VFGPPGAETRPLYPYPLPSSVLRLDHLRYLVLTPITNTSHCTRPVCTLQTSPAGSGLSRHWRVFYRAPLTTHPSTPGGSGTHSRTRGAVGHSIPGRGEARPTGQTPNQSALQQGRGGCRDTTHQLVARHHRTSPRPRRPGPGPSPVSVLLAGPCERPSPALPFSGAPRRGCCCHRGPT
jgi:hypothetical protein